MQLLGDLAAEGVIVLAGDAAGVAPHGVGGFEVLDSKAFHRRRMMWFQREEPGAAMSLGCVGHSVEQGAAGVNCGVERGKESSAYQAFRRNGLIPERKARTRGYDWENGKFWLFDVKTFMKYGPSSKLRRPKTWSKTHAEPHVSAALKDYDLNAVYSSHHRGFVRKSVFFREESPSSTGLAGICDSSQIHTALVNPSTAVVTTLATHALERGLHTSGLSIHPGIQSFHSEQSHEESFTSDTESFSTSALWAPNSFVTSIASLMTSPGFGSESATGLIPFGTIAPLTSVDHGYSAELLRGSGCSDGKDMHMLSTLQYPCQPSSNPLQLQASTSVSATICLPQKIHNQFFSQYPQQETKNNTDLTCSFRSSIEQATHRPFASSDPSRTVVPVAMGVDSASCMLRPFRPTPMRPMAGSGPLCSSLHMDRGAQDSFHSWPSEIISNGHPTRQIGLQYCSVAQQPYPTHKDECHHIPVGSLLNPS